MQKKYAQREVKEAMLHKWSWLKNISRTQWRYHSPFSHIKQGIHTNNAVRMPLSEHCLLEMETFLFQINLEHIITDCALLIKCDAIPF